MTKVEKALELLSDGLPHRAEEFNRKITWNFTKVISDVRVVLAEKKPTMCIPRNVKFHGTGVYMIVKKTKEAEFVMKVRALSRSKKPWNVKELI